MDAKRDPTNNFMINIAFHVSSTTKAGVVIPYSGAAMTSTASTDTAKRVDVVIVNFPDSTDGPKHIDWSNWRNFPQNRTSDRCFAINAYYPK
jgi:hypothetical protein